MKVLCTSTKICTNLSSVRRIAEHDLRLKKSYCHLTDGATLFSKVVSNKLGGNFENEITLICAKFGADMVSKVAPFFLATLYIPCKILTAVYEYSKCSAQR